MFILKTKKVPYVHISKTKSTVALTVTVLNYLQAKGDICWPKGWTFVENLDGFIQSLHLKLKDSQLYNSKTQFFFYNLYPLIPFTYLNVSSE